MENTNTYWVLYPNNSVKDLLYISDIPENIALSDWISGKKIDIPEDERIQIPTKSVIGERRGDMVLGDLPLFHRDFIGFLKEFGIDNIQSQAVDLINDEKEVTDFKYLLLNILDVIPCVKAYDLENPPFAGPERFEIDADKTNGLHIFRLAENPELIIISKELLVFLKEKETVDIIAKVTTKYLKSENLSIEALKNTKELISYVKKLRYKREFDEELVLSLLSNGADVNFYNPGDWTSKPAIVLAQNISNDTNRRNMIELLFKWGVDVNREFQYGHLIKEAANDGDIEGVKFYLEHGAVEGFEDALTEAIEKDHIDIIKLLVEKGADINNPPALKSCCEAYRCNYKKNSEKAIPGPIPGIETAKYLISKGADVNNSESFSSAVVHDFKELVILLFENGKTILETEQGMLSQAKSAKMIHLLVKLGYDPLELNEKDQSTYLMDSIFWGKKQLFKAFLKYDIDLYATDKEGKTAFHYGVRSENKKIVAYLLSIYDLERVNKILPVLGIADNPAIDALLKEKLGIVTVATEVSGDVYPTDFSNPEFKNLKALQSKLSTEIAATNQELYKSLAEIGRITSKALLNNLYKEMEENLSNWTAIEVPQCIVLEYPGTVTDPFDGSAMFYGYETCSKSEEEVYNLENPVDSLDEGALGSEYLFDEIDDFLEEFPNQSTEICDYYKYHAFIQLHAIFDKLEKAGKFKVDKPTLIFGRAHDEDPVLIYKIG
ncbi:ankyrin repeat domain-containing protein [Formosa sp. PL04]|uniref:ankyrin repeat domain-containing protein n=1 Tax=Formosa sp. PL04 TaxID=3081755 RepID=UPI002982707E|nr:ankyrin repeat domain-containing protein [Formosa sp. PL04]MDW5290811.1 ankyrin repeat domain-containing protein [Formosa sp. PL04]